MEPFAEGESALVPLALSIPNAHLPGAVRERPEEALVSDVRTPPQEHATRTFVHQGPRDPVEWVVGFAKVVQKVTLNLKDLRHVQLTRGRVADIKQIMNDARAEEVAECAIVLRHGGAQHALYLRPATQFMTSARITK
jgi:hypothetical protein